MSVRRWRAEDINDETRRILCETWEGALCDSGGKTQHEILQLGWLTDGRESVRALRERLTGRRALELYMAFSDDGRARPYAAGFIGRGAAASHMLYPDSVWRRIGARYHAWGCENEMMAIDAVFIDDSAKHNSEVVRAMVSKSLQERPPRDHEIELRAWVDSDNVRLAEAMRALKSWDDRFITGDIETRKLGVAGLGLSALTSFGRIVRIETPQEAFTMSLYDRSRIANEQIC